MNGRPPGGRYLRRRMAELQISYDDVARALGVHAITVRNWEKQKRLKRIVKLAFERAFEPKRRPGWMSQRAKVK